MSVSNGLTSASNGLAGRWHVELKQGCMKLAVHAFVMTCRGRSLHVEVLAHDDDDDDCTLRRPRVAHNAQ
jgi:hypothetical protein